MLFFVYFARLSLVVLNREHTAGSDLSAAVEVPPWLARTKTRREDTHFKCNGCGYVNKTPQAVYTLQAVIRQYLA